MKIIKNKRKNLFSNISIPELFIVKYMKEMPEEAVKLYIYLIYLETNQINVDIDQIAKDINLSLKEVKASFEYMQEKGIVIAVEEGYYLVDIQEKEMIELYTPKVTSNKDMIEKNQKKNNGREKIEDLFNTSLSAMNMDFGFISYEVAFNTNDRLKELIYISEGVKLDKKKVWNYDFLPHGLIAGTTGTGKTYFLNYLICNLLYQKCCITFIDPKMADVRAIGNIVNPSKTGCTEDEIYKLVRDFKNSMEERQQVIAQAKRTNITYKDCGLNAEFLIFDELAAFKSGGVEKNSKDKIKQVEADLRKVILMGRSTGNFVILVAQQPNADVVETGIRDQLGLKVAFGNTKEELRRMLFGTDIKLHILDTRIKGVGYLSLGNGEPYKYYAPDLSADFDYVEEIKKLMV